MTAIENKLAELDNGSTIIYDKQLVLSMSKKIKADKILHVEQLESCFLVRYATNREIQNDYNRMNLSNNNKDLKTYIEEVRIIWQKD